MYYYKSNYIFFHDAFMLAMDFPSVHPFVYAPNNPVL